MLAGGIGGTSGDLLMHSLDTVKTRQQGDLHFPPKYGSMSSSYATIFRQEGIRKGLYGGVEAAMLGSFPGTVIFFGMYEYSKRNLLDRGINPSLSYLTAGNAFREDVEIFCLLIFHRVCRRLCRFDRLRTLRSPQDSFTIARPLRQSFF